MHVWALSSTNLHRNTDAGTSWQSFEAPGHAPSEIDFVSTTQGWLASGPSIYRTINAGTTGAAIGKGTLSARVRALGMEGPGIVEIPKIEKTLAWLAGDLALRPSRFAQAPGAPSFSQ